MAMKDFDWKNFMVQKGERVALGVAGLIALILLAANVKSIFSAGPGKHAEALKGKTKTLRDQLASNRPTKESDKPVSSDDFMRNFAFTYINDPSRFQLPALFPVGGALDDKRLQPELKTPVEGKVAVIQGQLWSYIFRKNEKTQVLEIKIKDATGTATGATQQGRDRDREQVRNNFTGSRGGRAGNALGNSGGPGGGYLGDVGGGAAAEVRDDVKAMFVPVDTLADRQNAVLLHTVRPVRMAEIVAAFPYKDEIEEFRKKLKKRTAQEVLEEASLEEAEVPVDDPTAAPQRQQLEAFRFTGVVVERRQVDRQGRVLFPDAGQKDGSGWEPLDVVGAYKPLLIISGLQIQDEDPKLEDLMPDGLVMPRLYSARGPDQYPKIEEELPVIKKTLKTLEEERKKNANGFVGTRANNFNTDNFDPFSARGRTQNNQNTGKGASGDNTMGATTRPPSTPRGGGRQLQGPRGDGGKGAGQDGKLILPDYCLIRVLDVTVKPGESYQYRLRVEMANPNFKRTDVVLPQEAETARLKPNPEKLWFELPDIVTVPTELHYYAVDQKAIEKDYKGAYKDYRVGPDQTVLQVHKYLDNIQPTPNKSVPVGEWSVAERVIVTRGEVIDRTLRVEVPVLVEEEEKWKLASTPGSENKRDSGINVWFEGTKGRPTILVDFDRGRKSFKRAGGDVDVKDEPAEEVLILGPDGRLLAHNGAVDAADKEREDMLKAWRDRIEKVRKDNSDPMNPNQGGIGYDSFGRPTRNGSGGPGAPGSTGRRPGG